jgi:hypothetical protein
MPADSIEQNTVEQQALHALAHLSDKDKASVLSYIESLVTLEKVKNDQRSSTQDRDVC